MGDGYMMGDRDNSVSVPFSDDENVRDEELIVDEDKPNESPEEKRSRREKRQARLQQKLSAGKQAEEALAAERAEKLELRERLARLEGAVSAQTQVRNDNGRDPYEAELDGIYAEQQSAYAAAQAEVAAGKMTNERAQHYERVARDFESRKSRVHARREIAQTEPVRQQSQAQQVWVQKYPEVYGNQRAFQYAQGRYQSRLALGENISNATVDEIMEETKAQFKLGTKPAPSVSERAKFGGVPASGGGGGRTNEAITLSPALRRMAIAAHSDLSEEDAIKKWTQKTGKRLRETKVL